MTLVIPIVSVTWISERSVSKNLGLCQIPCLSLMLDYRSQKVVAVGLAMDQGSQEITQVDLLTCPAMVIDRRAYRRDNQGSVPFKLSDSGSINPLRFAVAKPNLRSRP
jgi:hypothetical protein